MGSRKANVMVVGKTGSGKTMTLSQVTQFFLAKSDVSQLKERYSGNDGEDSGGYPSELQHLVSTETRG
jgi:ATP-dependent protease Clp ATPase subunit